MNRRRQLITNVSLFLLLFFISIVLVFTRVFYQRHANQHFVHTTSTANQHNLTDKRSMQRQWPRNSDSLFFRR